MNHLIELKIRLNQHKNIPVYIPDTYAMKTDINVLLLGFYLLIDFITVTAHEMTQAVN